jgi:hypothetical protein
VTVTDADSSREDVRGASADTEPTTNFVYRQRETFGFRFVFLSRKRGHRETSFGCAVTLFTQVPLVRRNVVSDFLIRRRTV